MAKQKESKSIYVSSKNDPRLTAYNDSSILYNNYVKQYSAKGSKKSLTKEETKFAQKQIENPKSVWPQAKIKNVKGSDKIKKINYTDDGLDQDLVDDMVHPKIKPTGFFLHDSNFWDRNINNIYKKPTQKVEYVERKYQKESDPIKSKSIKGVDAKLPDLKRVEGPSKWMRSFGAGASENYWSKVDASGKPLPGSIAPNKNAVEQPAGPSEDYKVRSSVPLGMTEFNDKKK
jgi:hypothetical protein